MSEQKRDIRGVLLKVVGGSLFSVLFAAYFLLAVRFGGVDLAQMPILELLGIFGVFFWIVNATVWLIGKLPLKVVVVIFIVGLSFSFVGMWFWVTHIFGAVLP